MTVSIGPHATVENPNNLHDSAGVHDNAAVTGDAEISHRGRIGGYAKMSGGWLADSAYLRGEAIMTGGVVKGQADIGGKARISQNTDYMCLGPFGPDLQYYTVWREEFGHKVCGAGFIGTVEGFRKHLKKFPDSRKTMADTICDLMRKHMAAWDWGW